MELLITLLGDLIETLGLDFVLRALVEAGVLPSWVLPDVFTAQEHEAFTIETTVESLQREVQNPYHGLSRIYDAAHNAQADVTGINANLASILTQLANIASSIGGLPAPPSGDANAAAVWNYVYGMAESTGSQLQRLEILGDNIRYNAGLPWNLDGNFIVVGPWKPGTAD